MSTLQRTFSEGETVFSPCASPILSLATLPDGVKPDGDACASQKAFPGKQVSTVAHIRNGLALNTVVLPGSRRLAFLDRLRPVCTVGDNAATERDRVHRGKSARISRCRPEGFRRPVTPGHAKRVPYPARWPRRGIADAQSYVSPLFTAARSVNAAADSVDPQDIHSSTPPQEILNADVTNTGNYEEHDNDMHESIADRKPSFASGYATSYNL